MMVKVAIFGYRNLPYDTQYLVMKAIRDVVEKKWWREELTAISFLADGPEMMFAQEVLGRRGRLIAITPWCDEHYGHQESRDEAYSNYDYLVEQAQDTLDFDIWPKGEFVSNVSKNTLDVWDTQAHYEAIDRMLKEAEELIAVWDGEYKAWRGAYTDVAEVVHLARRMNVPVTAVWPKGAKKE